MDDKFEQISDIFSQFSEDNKDKLIETALSLLRVQMEVVASVLNTNDDVKKIKGRCPEKLNNRKG